MFHILQSDGLVFLAMSDSGFERRIAYAFLEEIKTRYLSIPPERSRLYSIGAGSCEATGTLDRRPRRTR
jgi:hypothetical protein